MITFLATIALWGGGTDPRPKNRLPQYQIITRPVEYTDDAHSLYFISRRGRKVEKRLIEDEAIGWRGAHFYPNKSGVDFIAEYNRSVHTWSWDDRLHRLKRWGVHFETDATISKADGSGVRVSYIQRPNVNGKVIEIFKNARWERRDRRWHF